MKRIERDRQFLKHYKKRIAPNPKLVKQFDNRVHAFALGKRDRPLDDHALSKKMKGLRAFSISGDLRVVYRETEAEITFLDIGTHNQVY